MVNIPYHTAQIRGQLSRFLYQALLPQLISIPVRQTRQVPVNVYALSCQRDFPEQVASIRSFIRYVGVPNQFIVISDGSYTQESCELLCKIHPCIKVISIEKLIRDDLPQSVYDYASTHPMGKKLGVLLSIPIEKTTIYTDSDVLFFPGAGDLVEAIASGDPFARYLPDCVDKFDPRVIFDESELLNPINAGFILFKKPLDWDFALDRLSKLEDFNNFFTEQTLVHLTLHHNKALPLCRKKYVLSIDDQFIYPDQFASKDIALRHYVRNVRRKFWFHLSL